MPRPIDDDDGNFLSHYLTLSLLPLCLVRGLSKKVTFNLFAGSHVCFNNSICTHISIICNRQFSYVGGVCTRKEERKKGRRKKSNIVYSIYISVITHTKPLLLLLSFSLVRSYHSRPQLDVIVSPFVAAIVANREHNFNRSSY